MPASGPAAATSFAPVRILGVDPGLAVTGWAVLVLDGNAVGVRTGVIRPLTADPTPQRLRTIFAGLQEVIATHQPHVLAVERPFVKDNVRSALALGHAQGAAFLAAAMHDLPVHEYAPREVKLAIAGDGHAEKQAVAAALALELGAAFPDGQPALLDESDALALAYTHHLHSRRPAGASSP